MLQMTVPRILCAEAMSARFTAEQVLEQIFSNVQQDSSDSEEEVEEVSEEEDGEEYNPEHDASSSEEEEIPQAERETFLSKNGKITWSSAAYDKQGRMAAQNAMKMTPGSTRYAVSHAHDIASTFNLFITPAIKKIILEMTNLEGFRKYGDSWKRMDVTDLHAYIGLLILVYTGPEVRLQLVYGMQRVEGQFFVPRCHSNSFTLTQDCYDLITVSQDLQDV